MPYRGNGISYQSHTKLIHHLKGLIQLFALVTKKEKNAFPVLKERYGE
jgi:hypothetical protein